MGEYVVLKRVAIGGMAEIFLARKDGPNQFERLVVLKRILPEYAHDAEFVRMFLNEARIAATLHHGNIVQVYGIGEERGQVFFAMEFLHGEDLSRVLSRANQLGRAPQLDGVLTIAQAVVAGLHYAHERTGQDGAPLHIVHRDVSPHNVFVTYDGNIKLLDFGIAKAATSFGKTRTGVLKGKVAYMSPEQAYSQPVDRRSDIFCMGILLWEMTTGRRLYRRPSELETLKALVDADAPRPSTVVSGYPAELEAIVMKCLQRDRDARYASGEQLLADLERFARDQQLMISPSIATKMMRTLFRSEIAAFEAAQKSGGNLVDLVIGRLERTAHSASIDDWDSDVASIVVDLNADAERTALTPVPSAPAVEDEHTNTDIAAPPAPDTAQIPVEDPIAPPPSPYNEHKIPVRASSPVLPQLARPLPGVTPFVPVAEVEPKPNPDPYTERKVPVRASSPVLPPLPVALTRRATNEATAGIEEAPMAAFEPQIEPPVVAQMPLERPVVQRAERVDPTEPKTRDDWTQRVRTSPPVELATKKKKSRFPLIICAAAVVSAVAVFLVINKGGDDSKPTSGSDRVDNVAKPDDVKPETVAKPEPVAKPDEAAAKPEEPVAKPVEPIAKPKPVAKTEPKPEPKIVKTEPKPAARRPVVEVKRPAPKPEPKKPEPKKPTPKDLDSLPL